MKKRIRYALRLLLGVFTHALYPQRPWDGFCLRCHRLRYLHEGLCSYCGGTLDLVLGKWGTKARTLYQERIGKEATDAPFTYQEWEDFRKSPECLHKRLRQMRDEIIIIESPPKPGTYTPQELEVMDGL